MLVMLCIELVNFSLRNIFDLVEVTYFFSTPVALIAFSIA